MNHGKPFIIVIDIQHITRCVCATMAQRLHKCHVNFEKDVTDTHGGYGRNQECAPRCFGGSPLASNLGSEGHDTILYGVG